MLIGKESEEEMKVSSGGHKKMNAHGTADEPSEYEFVLHPLLLTLFHQRGSSLRRPSSWQETPIGRRSCPIYILLAR